MAMEFLESQGAMYPDLVDQYNEFSHFFQKKLWHELSVAVDSFVSSRKNIRNNNYFLLYNEFICKFESRISQVKLAIIVSNISYSLNSPDAALEFLSKILNARERLGPEASLVLDMETSLVKLKLGAVEDAKNMLDLAKEKLSTINSSETIVFSKFYKALLEYRKIVGPAHEFYKAALMFLAYTPVDDLPGDEKVILATDIALASITGDNIYNFGEVLATPILSALKGTTNEWLNDLVVVLNKGDVDAYNLIVDNYRQQYYSQTALANRHDEVKQKVALLSLVNIAFERPSHDRNISFLDISTRTRLPLNQVEWLLMRAMSVGLIKGVIDQVDQMVSISWIVPRVLDKEQLQTIVTQLDEWKTRVVEATKTVEDQTLELFA